MPKLKSIIFNVLLFTGVLVFEILLSKAALPISILDLTLIPLVLVLVIYLIKVYLFDRKKKTLVHEGLKSSLLVSLGYTLFSLPLFALGLWCAYEGLMDPLGLFTGVKGSLHGYTLFLLGLVIMFFSTVVFYAHSKKVYLYMENSEKS